MPASPSSAPPATRPDLARFAWALLQRWEDADAPPADSWALDAQAALGDDETAARLAAAVRDWPYLGAHKRAATGLDVLAQLGTDAALTQLQDIATKMKAKAVKSRAELKLREVADALELTPDQLADRLVPHLDLTPDATFTLNYGPRRFVAGFDEQLKPYVLDESGTRRKDLPAPAASDDPHLAPAAQQRFTDAKKAVRKVATEQVRRLERAMVMQRHWTGADFRRTFLQHPLLWPIARRLVWLVAAPVSAASNAGTDGVGGLSGVDDISDLDTNDGVGGHSAMDGPDGDLGASGISAGRDSPGRDSPGRDSAGGIGAGGDSAGGTARAATARAATAEARASAAVVASAAGAVLRLLAPLSGSPRTAPLPALTTSPSTSLMMLPSCRSLTPCTWTCGRGRRSSPTMRSCNRSGSWLATSTR